MNKIANIFHTLMVITVLDILTRSVSEFNEFKPRLKSLRNWIQLSPGFNLEKLNTILSETNHI